MASVTQLPSATTRRARSARSTSSPLIKASVLKEGTLLKRQRGRSVGADLKNLKWQQRYISLTQDALCYYTDHKKGEKKGEFPVSQMRVIEKVPDATFNASNCIQIGDEKEVMYFKAKTEKERKEWMEAFRIAVLFKKNTMLEFYHTGAYGQVHPHKWSCCNAPNRDTLGCHKIEIAHRSTTSMIEDQHQSDSEKYRHSSIATMSSDTQSIDSGYLESAQNKPGDTPVSSRNVSRTSLSPSIHDSDPVQNTSRSEPCNQPTETEQADHEDNEILSQTWKVKLLVQDSESRVTSAIFRGADTLIATHKDVSVQIIDTGNLEKGAKLEYISSNDAIESVDVWKHFLVLGFLNIQLLNLNSTEMRKTLHKKNDDETYHGHPYIVVFTPRGHLLSYNKSQPHIINVWPKVESLWSLSTTETEGSLVLEDTGTVVCMIVSPNPSQPWLAVSMSMPDKIQVYDYHNNLFKSQLELPALTCEEKTVVSFSPTGENIAVGRGRYLTFYRIECFTSLFQLPQFGSSITSLAYNLWSRDTNLAIGFADGKIAIYSGLPYTPRLMASLHSKEASMAITCLAYSKDGQMLAAGSSSGKVILWRKDSSLAHVSGVVLVREGELEVDSKGKQYVSPDDGYAISIPPGAIPEGKTATLKHGVVPDGPFGPFEFPTGVRPVSAILSLHPTTEQPLLKPIEIALPHFIHCETQDHCNRLAVFKADCNSDGKSGKQICSFKKMTDVNLSLGMYCEDPKYPKGIPYAKFSTEHHCYWCIGEYGKEDTDRAIFSLVDVKPKVIDKLDDPIIHFCLLYFLPTCHRTIREQYPDESYNVNIQSVKFSPDESVTNPAIGINFREQLGDWLFSLQGGNDKQIYRQDVCFLDYPTPLYLKEMCQEKIYPPRFSICIHGIVRPSDVVKAEFRFPGAVAFPGREEPVAIVHLPLPAQRSLSAVSLLSQPNSASSTLSEPAIRALPVAFPCTGSPSNQQSLQPAAQAFKKYMCDLDHLHPSQLALSFFSNNLVDEPVLESIQESMKSSTKDEMVLRTEILLKVYNALKVDAKLSTPLEEALRKLNPVCARKFTSEMSRLSEEGSPLNASTSSLPTSVQTIHTSSGVPNVVDGSAYNSSALTSHSSPLQFPENLMETLRFDSQADHDSVFLSAEPALEDGERDYQQPEESRSN